MNVKESKIVNVQGAGTYQPDGGQMLYKFEYEFEDGSVLKANHKTEKCPFNVGDTVEYEVRGSNSYGSWGAVRKQGSQQRKGSGGGGYDAATTERIERSWAMDVAVKALGPITRPVTPDSMNVYMREVCRLANVMWKTRDTFPKFEQEDLVRAYWDSQMANDDDLPF